MVRRGFTLVELVLVLVILGIVAVFTSRFLGSSMLLYRDSQVSNERLAQASFMLTKMGRDIAGSYSSSVRLFGSNNGKYKCIQFAPVRGGGAYLNSVSNLSSAIGIASKDFMPGSGNFDNLRVVIGATAAVDIYQSDSTLQTGSGAVGIIDSYDENNPETGLATITLEGTRKFSGDSDGRRYFILGASSEAYCFTGSNLMLYEGLNWSTYSTVPVGAGIVERLTGNQLNFSQSAFAFDALAQTVSIRLVLDLPDNKTLVLNQLVFMNYGP
ncbi:prepilin-type N-terminal cleavage/methylation domain-containing protein [Dongshaea marina]|uniref:prepilin-type N-terminal cleavage/methylation domain-containing protein n=1 Tax=Dongshaea marina TaxID=2047966 RepID=UPI000D3E689A|nr:prepilin-type N-terminal cleavage/methylation domain-containing protein [Dongshaea marina]